LDMIIIHYNTGSFKKLSHKPSLKKSLGNYLP
jgi:hypothetical protein